MREIIDFCPELGKNQEILAKISEFAGVDPKEIQLISWNKIYDGMIMSLRQVLGKLEGNAHDGFISELRVKRGKYRFSGSPVFLIEGWAGRKFPSAKIRFSPVSEIGRSGFASTQEEINYHFKQTGVDTVPRG